MWYSFSIKHHNFNEITRFRISFSCLHALQYMKMEYLLIRMVIQKYVTCNYFCCVPSHVGIRGIEKAVYCQVCFGFAIWMVYLVLIYILFTWRYDRNGVIANKLHSVKPVLGYWQSSYGWCMPDEIVLYRAHIRHTHLVHSVYSDILATFCGMLLSDPNEE